MIDELVKKFKEWRINVLERTESRALSRVESEILLEKLNHEFPILLDDWDLLDKEHQRIVRPAYIQAQGDFHYVANLLLIEVAGPMEEANLNPPSPLRFGAGISDDLLQENSAVTMCHMPTFTTATEWATNVLMDTTPVENQQAMVSANKNNSEPIKVDLTPNSIDEQAALLMPNLVKIGQANQATAADHCDQPNQLMPNVTKINQPNQNMAAIHCNQSDQPQANDTITQQKMLEIMQLSYVQQVTLLEPILGLPPMHQESAEALKKFCDAIIQVNENAKNMNVLFDGLMERIIILQIVASLDQHSKNCWKYLLQGIEPSLERLANFLLNREKETQHSAATKESMPKETSNSFKIPKLPNRSPSLKGTARARSNSKNRARNKNARSRSPEPGSSFSEILINKRKRYEKLSIRILLDLFIFCIHLLSSQFIMLINRFWFEFNYILIKFDVKMVNDQMLNLYSLNNEFMKFKEIK